MAIATIQFTQEQARSLTGVTAGDLRHWRKAVPYLAAKPGKSARFSFSDLIGLAVTGELVHTFGVHITPIGAGINDLFHVLAAAKPSQIQDAVVVVTTQNAMLHPSKAGVSHSYAQPALMVPCQPLIAGMQEQMAPFSGSVEQGSLPFPPQIVGGGR